MLSWAAPSPGHPGNIHSGCSEKIQTPVAVTWEDLTTASSPAHEGVCANSGFRRPSSRRQAHARVHSWMRSENLLPWSATLVRCPSCPTVPSGRIHCLPSNLVTHPWLHSRGAFLWLPSGFWNQTPVLKRWVQVSSPHGLTFKAFYTLLPVCFSIHCISEHLLGRLL